MPDWTAPCTREAPDGRRYILACARVTGRVIYVQSEDPDEDGDTHLVTLAPAKIVIIKLRSSASSSVSANIGDLVTASGPVHDGRLGFPEIFAEGIEP